MSVTKAVRAEVRALGEAGRGSLAETALALARELDDAGNSATSKSMCAKAMVDVLRELRSIAPPMREKDDLDELRTRRASRRSTAEVASRP